MNARPTLLVRRILGLAVLTVRRDLAKDAGLLVLRHENAVLRRHVGLLNKIDRVSRICLVRRALKEEAT